MPFCEKENSNRWRGCLFCRTGQENKVASAFETLWPGTKAYSVSAAKRRSRNGVKSIGIEVIMKGYVFLEVDETFVPAPPFPDGVIRMLTAMDGSWQLTGYDDEFARWVIRHQGKLPVSQAYQNDERIVMERGPLKELESYIQKIDKRNGNALVQFEIGGNQIRLWLPFEIENKDRPKFAKQIEGRYDNG